MGDLCVYVHSDDICLLYTQGAAPPQLNIGVFAHMQSNGVVNATENWEMVEEEGPMAEDHLNRNVPGAGATGF